MKLDLMCIEFGLSASGFAGAVGACRDTRVATPVRAEVLLTWAAL